jgi:hypothetical protein
VADSEVSIVQRTRTTRFTLLLAAASICAIACLLPATASAQIAPGLRAGLSVDPDQFYVGGHIETGPLVERLVFRPNAEIGFGDDLTLVAVNFEFLWKFPQRTGPWGFYAGGGPAINLYQVDGPGDDAEPGFSFVGGLEHRQGFFFEFKVGAKQSPDFKFGVGITFR